MTARSNTVTSICDACLLRTRPSRPLRISPSTSSTSLHRNRNASTAAAYTTQASPSTSSQFLNRNSRRVCPSALATPRHSSFSTPSHRRAYSTPASSPNSTSSPPAKNANSKFHPSESGLVRLTNRRLISLSGADTRKFLQGLVTANVVEGPVEPFYCAFLDARGRVLWDVWVWPHAAASEKEGVPEDWGCYIDVDAAEVTSLVKHLKRHKLRSKVTIEILPEPTPESGTSIWTAWNLTQPQVDFLSASDAIPSLSDARFPTPFVTRFLYRGTSPPEILSLLGNTPLQNEEMYRVWRYLCGVPEGQKEILRETALPMEYNIDLARGIDFRKGCYVGQELTIRTKHTGVVRKRVLPVRLYRAGEAVPRSVFSEEGVDMGFASSQSSAPSESQSPSQSQSHSSESLENTTTNDQQQPAIKTIDPQTGEKKGRPVGKLVARVGDVGLALCRLDVMTAWRGGDGTMESAFIEGQEFEVVDEGGVMEGVRVRAFLPEWLVEKERGVWGRKERKKVAVETGEEDVE